MTNQFHLVRRFIYGGNTNTQSYSNYGGTYVLSLPSFTWTKATDMRDGLARSHHACVSLNSTSSQFVSLGGVQVTTEETNWEDKDPFPQSIGIYDMNNLTWVDSYDPAAEPYVTNSKIRSWYVYRRISKSSWCAPAHLRSC